MQIKILVNRVKFGVEHRELWCVWSTFLNTRARRSAVEPQGWLKGISLLLCGYPNQTMAKDNWEKRWPQKRIDRLDDEIDRSVPEWLSG